MPSRRQEVGPHAERRSRHHDVEATEPEALVRPEVGVVGRRALSALRQLPGIPRGVRLFAGTTHGPTSHTPTSPKFLHSEPLGYGNGCPQVGALGLRLQIA